METSVKFRDLVQESINAWVSKINHIVYTVDLKDGRKAKVFVKEVGIASSSGGCTVDLLTKSHRRETISFSKVNFWTMRKGCAPIQIGLKLHVGEETEISHKLLLKTRSNPRERGPYDICQAAWLKNQVFTLSCNYPDPLPSLSVSTEINPKPTGVPSYIDYSSTPNQIYRLIRSSLTLAICFHGNGSADLLKFCKEAHAGRTPENVIVPWQAVVAIRSDNVSQDLHKVLKDDSRRLIDRYLAMGNHDA
jgi:hypothetical protein